jgi:hypothetical protein
MLNFIRLHTMAHQCSACEHEFVCNSHEKVLSNAGIYPCYKLNLASPILSKYKFCMPCVDKIGTAIICSSLQCQGTDCPRQEYILRDTEFAMPYNGHKISLHSLIVRIFLSKMPPTPSPIDPYPMVVCLPCVTDIQQNARAAPSLERTLSHNGDCGPGGSCACAPTLSLAPQISCGPALHMPNQQCTYAESGIHDCMVHPST